MKYAIIAAGEGSRLQKEGWPVPKPMVRIGDKTLIERLLEIFIRNNAEEVFIIINEQIADIKSYIESLAIAIPVHIYIQSTPSSLHSFAEIVRRNPDLKELCLTTTDTIFDESDFQAYIAHFERASDLDGLMAVTDYVDDESPLYIAFDEQKALSRRHCNRRADSLLSMGLSRSFPLLQIGRS